MKNKYKKPESKKPYSKNPVVKILMQGVSKKNEKFKGVKMTLADLKSPLF